MTTARELEQADFPHGQAVVLAEKFDHFDRRFDAVETRLQALELRMTALEGRMFQLVLALPALFVAQTGVLAWLVA